MRKVNVKMYRMLLECIIIVVMCVIFTAKPNMSLFVSAGIFLRGSKMWETSEILAICSENPKHFSGN